MSSTQFYLQIPLAIIGGLALNLMPCVLPVLSIKLMSMMNNKERYKSSLIWTICGIIFSFWCVSIVSIVLRDAGKIIGIGFGYQNTQFLICIIILLTFFTSLSLDRVNINLNILDSLCKPIASLGFLKDFFSGSVIAIMSLPCTAPFLGSAIAFALFADKIENFILFTSIALGFSLPYILCIFEPRVLNLLPKSGSWLLYFKKILSGLLIISLIWFIIIVAGQLSIRSSIGLTLIVILIKFCLEEERIKPLTRAVCILTLSILALYLPKVATEEDL
jgi:suppressor for copper-sensitivity B